MFDVFRLSCLDYLVWLRSGKGAASRLNCNQATVSRNANSVAEFLGLDACKLEGEWRLGGDLSLLNAERKVHQLYRWSRGQSLRIDSVYGVGAPYFQESSVRWVYGPSDFLNVSYPLALLKDSILDAWLACYPDVPDDDEFIVINLTRYPSYFLVDRNHPLLERSENLQLDDLQDFPVLSLPDGAFPRIQNHLKGLGFHRSNVGATRHEIKCWEGLTEDQLTISYGTVHTIGTFGGGKVPLPLSTGLTVGDSLVVKRCFSSSVFFRELVLYLSECAQSLADTVDDLECCSDPLDWLSNTRAACS